MGVCVWTRLDQPLCGSFGLTYSVDIRTHNDGYTPCATQAMQADASRSKSFSYGAGAYPLPPPTHPPPRHTHNNLQVARSVRRLKHWVSAPRGGVRFVFAAFVCLRR